MIVGQCDSGAAGAGRGTAPEAVVVSDDVQGALCLPMSLAPSPPSDAPVSGSGRDDSSVTVAVLCAAFDPITSAELRLATEVTRAADVDLVLLVPFGSEYASVDNRFGGLLALSRFLLCHAGVESTLPPDLPVRVVGLKSHEFPTSAVLAGVAHWATDQAIRLVRIHSPTPGAVHLIPFSTDAVLPATTPLADSTPLCLPGGSDACLSLLPEGEVRTRLKSKAAGVRGLVPRCVLSIMERYGLYFRRAPSTPHWWYADGWNRLYVPPTPPPSPPAASSSTTATPVATASRTPPPPVCSTSACVSVFGGSFAPITSGHMEIAAEALNSGLASQVWFVPCGRRPDKPSLVMPVLDRYLHCLLAVEDVFEVADPVYVCPIEVTQPKALPSVKVISRLSDTYSDKVFEMFIGADLLPTLHRWAHADVLLRDVSFLVTPRPGTDLSDILEPSSPTAKPPLPRNLRAVTMPDGVTLASTSLSSTEIRSRGVGEDAVAGLVPNSVLQHITRYTRTPPH